MNWAGVETLLWLRDCCKVLDRSRDVLGLDAADVFVGYFTREVRLVNSSVIEVVSE